jgi:predicted transposase YdaD
VVADKSVAASFSQAVATAETEMKDASMTTIAEMWQAEGEARGRAEGKADTLRKQLTLKFGELTEATDVRIAAASEAELDRWALRVLTADTLVGVLGA